mmetsp:Transcript_104283/g.196288  ORF Transcript_104283/g.196288 Transcript_104283/m.196288 type:complete len:203 (-) Transcript_104283:636-1244(-)
MLERFVGDIHLKWSSSQEVPRGDICGALSGKSFPQSDNPSLALGRKWVKFVLNHHLSGTVRAAHTTPEFAGSRISRAPASQNHGAHECGSSEWWQIGVSIHLIGNSLQDRTAFCQPACASCLGGCRPFRGNSNHLVGKYGAHAERVLQIQHRVRGRRASGHHRNEPNGVAQVGYAESTDRHSNREQQHDNGPRKALYLLAEP